jgi:flagellar biosynthesis protein FlhG
MKNDQALPLRNLSRKYIGELAENQQPKESEQPVNRRRKIVLASGKGGVGKSVISVLLGKALSDIGKKVLIVDANPYSPALHILTNTNSDLTVRDLLDYGNEAEFVEFPAIAENLHVLPGVAPSSQETYAGSTNAAYFLEALAPYTANYDYVIFDTITGFDDWNATLFEFANDVFLVTLTEPTSIIESYTFMKSALNYFSGENFWLLINQTLVLQNGHEAHEKLNLALQHFISYKIPLLGAIPFDYDLKSEVDNQSEFWLSSQIPEVNKAIQIIVKQYVTTAEKSHKTAPNKEVVS